MGEGEGGYAPPHFKQFPALPPPPLFYHTCLCRSRAPHSGGTSLDPPSAGGGGGGAAAAAVAPATAVGWRTRAAVADVPCVGGAAGVGPGGSAGPGARGTPLLCVGHCGAVLTAARPLRLRRRSGIRRPRPVRSTAAATDREAPALGGGGARGVRRHNDGPRGSWPGQWRGLCPPPPPARSGRCWESNRRSAATRRAH